MCMGARAYTELTSAASGIPGDLGSNSIGYIGGRNTLRWRTETYSGRKMDKVGMWRSLQIKEWSHVCRQIE